jgi:hypothetical protein
MPPDILDLCWRSRNFLEPRWLSLHQSWGEPLVEKPSRYMCRYTSIFLKEVLNAATPESWRLVAGRPVRQEQEGTEAGGFGFCTSSGLFFDHCWVQSVDLIVDLTADQFGADAVIITPVKDCRYHPNLEEVDFYQDIAKLYHRPAKWLRELQSLLTEN